VVYTDGLSEARNNEDVKYGGVRISDLLKRPAAPRNSAETLIRDLTAFHGRPLRTMA
jgi:hypothetical protein